MENLTLYVYHNDILHIMSYFISLVQKAGWHIPEFAKTIEDKRPDFIDDCLAE